MPLSPSSRLSKYHFFFPTFSLKSTRKKIILRIFRKPFFSLNPHFPPSLRPNELENWHSYSNFTGNMCAVRSVLPQPRISQSRQGKMNYCSFLFLIPRVRSIFLPANAAFFMELSHASKGGKTLK